MKKEIEKSIQRRNNQEKSNPNIKEENMKLVEENVNLQSENKELTKDIGKLEA